MSGKSTLSGSNVRRGSNDGRVEPLGSFPEQSVADGEGTGNLTAAETDMRKKIRLHLGCGTHIVPGWVNIDGSWNARLAMHPWIRRIAATLRIIPQERATVSWGSDVVCHNVTRPLPFEDASVHCIYTSHMLEHLYRDEAKCLLEECLRLLVVNGVLRIVVPDLYTYVLRYIESKHGERKTQGQWRCAADQLNADLILRNVSRPKGGFIYKIYTNLLDFHSHKWMYDAESLGQMLVDVGFTDVKECEPFSSQIADIKAIEQADRTLDGQGICVEGTRR